MNRKLAPTPVFAVLTVLTLCACAGSKIFTGSGLYTGKIGSNHYPKAGPGETQSLERMYHNAPPMIPHSVTDFTITRENNDCLSCHADGAEISEGHIATKVPDSHYVNGKTGERYEDRVWGMRYNCLQCHTPQSTKNPPIPLRKS